MEPREPNMEGDGFVFQHDMRCPVLSGKHAVLNLNDGFFYPSWDAQRLGWRMVKADNWFKRWLLKTFFNIRR